MEADIIRTAEKSYYMHLRPEMSAADLGRDLMELRSLFTPEITIYIDLDNFHELGSDYFNLLYDLAVEASKSQVYILYTNVHSDIEERIELVTSTGNK